MLARLWDFRGGQSGVRGTYGLPTGLATSGVERWGRIRPRRYRGNVPSHGQRASWTNGVGMLWISRVIFRYVWQPLLVLVSSVCLALARLYEGYGSIFFLWHIAILINNWPANTRGGPDQVHSHIRPHTFFTYLILIPDLAQRCDPVTTMPCLGYEKSAWVVKFFSLIYLLVTDRRSVTCMSHMGHKLLTYGSHMGYIYKYNFVDFSKFTHL